MGGIAKGQIVREIDAMGGYSGIVGDHSAIQFRMEPVQRTRYVVPNPERPHAIR